MVILASLALSVAIQSGIQAADYGSTQLALANGGREGNPLMVHHMLLKTVAADAGLSVIDYGLSRKSKALVWVFRGAEGVAVGIIAAHNVSGRR